MAGRRQRRSLLGTPQPIQRTRGPVEDAPPVPRRLDAYAYDDLPRDDDDEDIEDAPTDSMQLRRAYMPPDPGLVEHDLTIDELDELPVDAIDDMEPLDDEDLDELDDGVEEVDDVDAEEVGGDDGTGDEIEIVDLETGAAVPHLTLAPQPSDDPTDETDPPQVPPSPRPPPATAPVAALPLPPPEPVVFPRFDGPPPLTANQLYTRMFGAFFGMMAVTFSLVLVLWVLLISPVLDARRARARPSVAPQPVVVEKVVPVPVPVPTPAPDAVADAADSEGADSEGADGEGDGDRVDGDEAPEDEAVAADGDQSATIAQPAQVEPEPRAQAAPRARPTPRPTPRTRPAPRAQPRPAPRAAPRPTPVAKPSPAPAPRPTPKASPAPVAKPAPETTAAVAPVVVAPPTPAKTPDEALALNGRMRGKAAGDALYLQVLLRSKGRATMHVKRGTAPWKTAQGSYTLAGDVATLTVTEPGDSPASYRLTVDGSGAEGTITLPDGKEKPVKAKR